MGCHGGGHAACLRLDGAADLHKARLHWAGTAVVVVVLALAQAPFAGAPAHLAVAGVLSVDIQADHQARDIDQLVKGFTPFGQKELLVQVVAGCGVFLTYFTFDHQYKRLGPSHVPFALGKAQNRMRQGREGVCVGAWGHVAILEGGRQDFGPLNFGPQPRPQQMGPAPSREALTHVCMRAMHVTA